MALPGLLGDATTSVVERLERRLTVALARRLIIRSNRHRRGRDERRSHPSDRRSAAVGHRTATAAGCAGRRRRGIRVAQGPVQGRPPFRRRARTPSPARTASTGVARRSAPAAPRFCSRRSAPAPASYGCAGEPRTTVSSRPGPDAHDTSRHRGHGRHGDARSVGVRGATDPGDERAGNPSAAARPRLHRRRARRVVVGALGVAAHRRAWPRPQALRHGARWALRPGELTLRGQAEHRGHRPAPEHGLLFRACGRRPTARGAAAQCQFTFTTTAARLDGRGQRRGPHLHGGRDRLTGERRCLVPVHGQRRRGQVPRSRTPGPASFGAPRASSRGRAARASRAGSSTTPSAVRPPGSPAYGCCSTTATTGLDRRLRHHTLDPRRRPWPRPPVGWRQRR